MDELTKSLEQLRSVALKIVSEADPTTAESRIALSVLTSLGTIALSISYEQDRLKYDIDLNEVGMI